MTLLLLLATLAHADVVNDPPADCPRGSRGTTSHIGEWCEPDDCTSSTTCEADQECSPVGLCVTTEEVGCGGMQPDTGAPCTFIRHVVSGTCETQSDCKEGTCETADRCAAPKSACGCSSVSPVALGLGLLAGLLVAGGRRRPC